MIVTYIIPSKIQQGAIAMHRDGKCILIRGGFTAKDLLRRVDTWAVNTIDQAYKREA